MLPSEGGPVKHAYLLLPYSYLLYILIQHEKEKGLLNNIMSPRLTQHQVWIPDWNVGPNKTQPVMMNFGVILWFTLYALQSLVCCSAARLSSGGTRILKVTTHVTVAIIIVAISNYKSQLSGCSDTYCYPRIMIIIITNKRVVFIL